MKKVLILVAILLIGIALLFMAPRFLIHETPYQKVDAVILILGPDFSARQKEAHDLVRAGMADYLIIPAYNRVYRINDGDTILLREIALSADDQVNTDHAPSYYERTHLELIDARNLMAMASVKSAIFVSSPYHMRRIKMMVSKVFDDASPYYYLPTRYESAPQNVWEMTANDARNVWREYLKISWFLIYSLWTT